MKQNHVACQGCTGWDHKRRYQETCRLCNNTKEVLDPKAVLCNLCGESMRPLGTANEQYPHGLENARVCGGYHSYHLLDLSTYTFSLCEKCLRHLFMQFKIKPQVGDLLASDVAWSWDNDQAAYEYRVWVDNGGHHQAYLDRKCNAIKDCPNKAIYTQLINEHFTESCFCETHKETHNYSNGKLVPYIPNVLKPFL